MRQSSFDVVVTGNRRTQTVLFLREFLRNETIGISELYGRMTMRVANGEWDTVTVLDHREETVDSLFDMDNEDEGVYDIRIKSPDLKRTRFWNVDVELLKAEKANSTVLRAVEGCGLLLYVLSGPTEVAGVEKDLRALARHFKAGTSCLLLLTGFTGGQLLGGDVIPGITGYMKDPGLRLSYFLFEERERVPEDIRSLVQYGKEELWQVIDGSSRENGSFVFGKQTQELLQNIRTTVETIEKILARYYLDGQMQKEIQDAIYAVKRKCSDSNFYLGVVGEFSSGKSTLVNAFLRDDLLTTSPRQSTTCSATYISYSAQIGIKIGLSDGSSRGFTVRGKEDKKQLFDLIDKYAAEESSAACVEAVSITYPFTGQDRYLVLIDTPGVNVNNPRHIALTQDVIKRECDAFIVVIPADAPMGRSLEVFIRNHVGTDSNRCIFAVTKLDLCQGDQKKEKILQDITNKLEKSLGICTPVLVPMTSTVILDELYREEGYFHTGLPPAYREELYWDFITGEAQILQMLQKNKVKLQSESVAAIIDRVYGLLLGELKKVSEGLHEDFKRLMAKDPYGTEEGGAGTVLERKQTVNRDIAQLIKCKEKLESLKA